MRHWLSIRFVCLWIGSLCFHLVAQESLFYQTKFATAAERAKLKEELLSKTIVAGLSKPLTRDNESDWITAFWAMELLKYRSALGQQALQHALHSFQQRSSSFQRAALEAIYALYGHEFTREMTTVMKSTSSPKLFAMAALHLLRQNESEKNRKALMVCLQKRFPRWAVDPILRSLALTLQQNRDEWLRQRPALADLFRDGGQRNQTVIFSIQRHNRDYPGLSIIKKPDQTFLRHEDGSLWSIPHFTQSLSALPGYLTNGQTPQGIFSLQNIEPATSDFIGPTPALVLVLPFEAPLNQYFHDPTIQDTLWTIEKYQKLLPPSWCDYQPIYEAFYAGQAGRYEIIAHGTTIDPTYYRPEKYYPFTPSLGCLTALEVWDEKDGRQLYSDQVALLRALKSIGSSTGYLIVVEKDDIAAPVTVSELIIDVLRAETSP